MINAFGVDDWLLVAAQVCHQGLTKSRIEARNQAETLISQIIFTGLSAILFLAIRDGAESSGPVITLGQVKDAIKASHLIDTHHCETLMC